MMKYILCLGAIALGSILVIKTEWFVQNFGSIAWAEQHLGTEGGTRLAYKLMGIILIVASLMIATGVMQNLFLALFAPMFGGIK
jgi:hypothetical protein